MPGLLEVVKRPGKFIVIDGMDGSGKSTQIKMLQNVLGTVGVLYTREPGGSPRAEQLRLFILDRSGPPSTPLCDFFCFWAARSAHMEQAVIPALKKSSVVISDRADSSTFAFQIWGEEYPEFRDIFVPLRTMVYGVYEPDIYIILDLPAEISYERRRKEMEQEKTRFDVKPLAYHRRVRNGFRAFGDIAGQERVFLVDAQGSPKAVHDRVYQFVQSVVNE
jgi:dTMP kinase